MQLYRYFKGHRKSGHWYPIVAGGVEEQEAYGKARYGFCTILQVASESGTPEEPEGRRFYRGPFYLDIDTDGNVTNSIKVARAAIKRLTKMGVDESHIDVWLSGKKGVHIEVPMDVFTDEAAVENLPHVYKELAKAFGIEDLDWSVYSLGRGRCWRLPSRKREDNDAYKVITSIEELSTMNAEKYAALCKEPSRPYEAPPPVKKRNSVLETLYRFAKQKAGQYKPVTSTLIDANMKNALGDAKIPPCVQHLQADTNIREGTGFNQKSVQMMKAVRAFVPANEQKDELEIFVVNSSGDSYATPELRRNHVQRSFGSVAGGRDYTWSCRSVLSILKQPPCENCPIQFIRWQQEEEAEEEYIRKSEAAGVPHSDEGEERREYVQESKLDSDDLRSAAQSLVEDARLATDVAASAPGQRRVSDGSKRDGGGLSSSATNTSAPRSAPEIVEDASEGLTIHDGCYAFITKDGFKRVTNFVIKITKVYIEHVPSLGEDRRVAVQAQVFMKRRFVGTVNIEEEAWNSSSAFTAAFNGIGNLTYLGKDEEVKRMKSSLLDDIEKRAVNIRRVHSYGIHRSKVAGQNVFTYVEPGWSIDNFGNENLYALSGRMSGSPKLQHIPALQPGEGDQKLTNNFKLLFGINNKATIATLLGWNMACFFKQHIFSYRNEFPLVSVWGNAQAGKTQTTGLFAALHGIHYLGGEGGTDDAAPISLGGTGSTVFTTWVALSESMTVPKLVEEFNQASLKNKYDDYVENFKRCYNQHAVKRGSIRNSKLHGTGVIDAYSADIPLTAPTLLISEQSIQVPALVQRCIQIQMNEDQRRGPGMETNFEKLKRQYTHFDVFAKTAYMETLQITAEQVDAWISKWKDKVPAKIGDRPHFSYCVALAGLDYLIYLSDKYGLNISEEVSELAELLVEMTNLSSAEIAQRKSQSEADRVMNELAVMAELSSKEDERKWLTKGQYYIREGNSLYVDGIAAHAQYLRFTVSKSEKPIIATFQQFKELIRHTRYCESVAAVKDGFARGRQVLKFNVALMSERGIEVQCFEEST